MIVPTATAPVVVLAEDDDASREVATALLTQHGFVPHGCTNGAEALALARRLRPSAIVSDALMPVLDGFALCQQVRQDAALCNTPVILYTATYTESEDRALAHDAGADALIIKPDEADRLVPAIREAIARAQVTRRAPQPRPANAQYVSEYARRMASKLQAKVSELRERNAQLVRAERRERELNAELTTAIDRLEREIADRQRLEETLVMAEEVAGTGSLVIGIDGSVVHCSRGARRILGLQRGNAVSLGTDALLALVNEAQQPAVARLLSTEAPADVDSELEVELPAAAERAVRTVVMRVRRLSGRERRHALCLVTLHDITDRVIARQREREYDRRLREAQKLEAIGNLAAGVAHDFNNLLAGMQSHGEMLRVDLAQVPIDDAERAASVQESLEGIVGTCARAKDLVSQILSYSRRQPMVRELVRIPELLREVENAVRPTLPAGVQLVVDASLADPRCVGGATPLFQVFLNLVTNAVQAIESRAGTVTVRGTPLEITRAMAERHEPLQPGPAVCIEVSDTGTGLDATTLTRIFEPFFTSRAEQGGTGLGLAIAQSVVADHGGVIVTESALGRGTTFRVILPRNLPAAGMPAVSTPPGGLPAMSAMLASSVVAAGSVAERPPAAAMSAPVSAAAAPMATPAEGPTFAPSGQRILLVDDEPSVTRAATRFLSHLGYRVKACTDPLEAQALLLGDPAAWDLVLTDRTMPRLSGEQLQAVVAAVRPDLPFVLMTGYGGRPEDERARAGKFRGVITKPFTLAALREACEAALGA